MAIGKVHSFKKSGSYFLLPFLLFLLPIGLAAQQESSTNLNFIFGFSDMSVDRTNYTLRDFQMAYPQTNISTFDFSDYRFDSLSSHDVFALVPTLLALEWGIPLRQKKNSFFQRSEHRLKVWCQSDLLYENNMEKIEYIGNSIKGNDIIYRDFYDVTITSYSFGFTYGLHHKSNYKGKNKNLRFWFGMGIMNAISVLSGTVLQVEGTYEVTEPFPTAHNAYYYPQTDLSFKRVEKNYNFEKKYLTGFEIPIGIELLSGKKDRFHTGAQVSIGGALLTEQGMKTMATLNFMGGINFRFQLRNQTDISKS